MIIIKLLLLLFSIVWIPRIISAILGKTTVNSYNLILWASSIVLFVYLQGWIK